MGPGREKESRSLKVGGARARRDLAGKSICEGGLRLNVVVEEGFRLERSL